MSNKRKLLKPIKVDLTVPDIEERWKVLNEMQQNRWDKEWRYSHGPRAKINHFRNNRGKGRYTIGYTATLEMIGNLYPYLFLVPTCQRRLYWRPDVEFVSWLSDIWGGSQCTPFKYCDAEHDLRVDLNHPFLSEHCREHYKYQVCFHKKRLHPLDSNNRSYKIHYFINDMILIPPGHSFTLCTTDEIQTVPDDINPKAPNQDKDGVGNRGWYFSDFPKSFQLYFKNHQAFVEVQQGNTWLDNNKQFKTFNTDGSGINKHERRDCSVSNNSLYEASQIARILRERLFGPDILNSNELKGYGLYGEQHKWFDDRAKMNKKEREKQVQEGYPRLNYPRQKAISKWLTRHQVNTEWQAMALLFLHRGKDEKLSTKSGYRGIDCNDRLVDFVMTDDDDHIKELQSAKFAEFEEEYFVPAIRSYFKYKTTKRTTKTTKTHTDLFADRSTRHDVTHILLCQLVNKLEIKDWDAFWDMYWKFDAHLCEEYAPSEKHLEESRKNPKFKLSKSGISWAHNKARARSDASSSNWRKGIIYKVLEDESHEFYLDKWVVAGALKYKRGDYDIAYKVELLNSDRCAPGIELEDVMERKTDVDHFIPLEHGGKEDKSNQWLMFSTGPQGNRKAQDNDKFEFFENSIPGFDLRRYLESKGLLFLTDRDLPEPGPVQVDPVAMHEAVEEFDSEEDSVVKKNESCVLSAK